MTKRALLPIVLALAGCDVSPVAAPPAGPTPTRGVLVVDTLYASTNIAFAGWDGVFNRSLLSSSASPAGLSAALSGNVVVPQDSPTFSGDIVILDRGQSVVTWVDAGSGAVKAQLPVADGFAAYPPDYLEISTTKAYVPRWWGPGVAQGDDIAVIDLGTHQISRTIALHHLAAGAWAVDPSRLVLGARANEAWAVLPRPKDGVFCDTLDGALARLDTTDDRLVGVETVAGMKNCGAAARLDDRRLVVVCTGLVGQVTESCKSHGGGGIVVLRDDVIPAIEEARFTDEMIGLAGVALGLNFVDVADDDLVIFAALGDKVRSLPDRWMSIDVAKGVSSMTEIARGAPYDLGDLRCDRARAACFGADAGAKTLRRFAVQSRALVEQAPTGYVDPYGLPPRGLGRFR